MAEESVRDLVRHVRAVLQEKGPLGAFLLSELDTSISRGGEELGSANGTKNPHPDQVIGRRMATDEELLEIVVSTLETYLLTLPRVVDSLTSQLRESFGIREIEVTLDPSLLSQERQEAGRAPINLVIPRLRDGKALTAIKELAEVVLARHT